jgi:hypothetical protein
VSKTSGNWLADSAHQLNLAQCEAMTVSTGADLDVAVSIRYSRDFDEAMQWREVIHLGSDVMSGMTPDRYQQLKALLIDTGHVQLLEPREKQQQQLFQTQLLLCPYSHSSGSSRILQKLIKKTLRPEVQHCDPPAVWLRSSEGVSGDSLQLGCRIAFSQQDVPLKRNAALD